MNKAYRTPEEQVFKHKHGAELEQFKMGMHIQNHLSFVYYLSSSPSAGSAAPQYDLEQMLGFLPTQNLPPFLQTLVSSLQFLQTEVS